MRRKTVFVILLLCGFGLSNSPAQEINALITGTVTDPSGAAVVGATITAFNLGTGVRATTKSGTDGTYFLTQLPRGDYRLTVESAGFRQFSREPIRLNVGDKTNVSVSLELGATTESVTVTAELTGIESNQSVTGQLLVTKQLAELPLNGRNFFMMLQFSTGVIFTNQSWGPTGWTMPNQWASGGPSGGPFTMQGGRTASNSFMMDGATQGMEGGPSYIPPPESIEDVKVVTPTSDASHGLSGGGVVNMTMKSGTNQLHGTVSHFFRNNRLSANFIQTNRAAATNPGLKNQRSQFNAPSVVVGGPIIKNKLFFSGNYDAFRLRQAYPTTITLATMAQRSGDFSQTFNAAGQLIQIYDPLSTRQQGSGFARDPFAGNRLSANRMLPVSLNIMKLMPEPNTVSDITNVYNYTNNANVGEQNYDGEFVKIDYIWNAKNRSFASQHVDVGHSIRSTNGIPYGNPLIAGDDFVIRQDYAATLDHVYTINPTTVLNVRLAWDRWVQAYLQLSKGSFDGSKLGFLGPIGSDPVVRIPALSFTNYTSLGTASKNFTTFEPYTFVTDLSKTISRHLLRIGTRIGQVRYNRVVPGNWDGTFSFTTGFTQRNPQSGDTTSGNAMAALLLGFPGSGSTDTNAGLSYEDKFIGFYIQDDFKVSRKLTLNLGLRWDVQTAPTERFNRMNIGFDPNVTYPLGGAQAKGGLLFADARHRQAWSTKYRDFQPRFGAAYQVIRKLVWRGGYGVSFLPLNSSAVMGQTVYQYGFSRSTPYVATIGGGVNSYIPAGSFANPFPDGILQPFGTSLGPKTLLGQSMTYFDAGYVIPRVHQFHAGFAYELPWKTTMDVSYVGSRTRRLRVAKDLNVVSLQDRLQGVADPNYLNASVSNPFAGAPELTGTSLFASTVARSQTLLPFPQFTGVSLNGNNIGSSTYDSLQLRVNKRLSNGLLLTTVYTFAKALEATSYREAQTPDLLRQLSSWDRTHHVVVYVLYDLPIGRSKALGKTWPKALDLIAGNWQYNVSYEYMNGTPVGMPNATPVRDPRLPAGQQNLNRWFNTCTLLTNGTRSNCASPDEPVAWVQLKPNELRIASTILPNIRIGWRPQINTSIMKKFPIREKIFLDFRLEAFNALNNRTYSAPTTTVTSPDFGKVAPNQSNFPRELQLSLQLRF